MAAASMMVKNDIFLQSDSPYQVGETKKRINT